MRFRTTRSLTFLAAITVAGFGLASTNALSGFRPLPEVPSDCGFIDEVVPDFTLADMNPNSDGYGEALGLSDVLGQVLVIYWANAN